MGGGSHGMVEHIGDCGAPEPVVCGLLDYVDHVKLVTEVVNRQAGQAHEEEEILCVLEKQPSKLEIHGRFDGQSMKQIFFGALDECP